MPPENQTSSTSFRFLHDVVAVGRGFEQAIADRGGVTNIRSLAARRYSDISIKVRIGDEFYPNIWEYHLVFSQDNNQARPLIKRETVVFDGHEVFRHVPTRMTTIIPSVSLRLIFSK